MTLDRAQLLFQRPAKGVVGKAVQSIKDFLTDAKIAHDTVDVVGRCLWLRVK